jgi:Do/DeqQ family serine protease
MAKPSPAPQLPNIRETAKKVLPSVVKVDVVETKKERQADGSSENPFFQFFFDDPERQREKYYQNESLGSGVIVRRVNSTYYILTNAHVVEGAETISVTHDDGREFIAKLVGKDERRDLALLSIESKDVLVPIALGDSDLLAVGDWVVAVGSPYGFQSTVTLGIVSALGRRGGPSDTIVDYIQSDAAINKGNSGGALVNLKGELVGINTWISSQGGGSIGLGFAVPSKHTRKVIDDLIAFGAVKPAWLGISMFTLDKELATSYLGKVQKGALVTGLYAESPASKAGIRLGDVLIGFGKDSITDAENIILAVANARVGDKLELRYLRDGKAQKTTVTLASRESDEALAAAAAATWPGYAVYPLTRDKTEQLKIDIPVQGLLIRQVITGSSAERAGLALGDIITSIDGKKMLTLQEFFSYLGTKDQKSKFLFEIWREGKILEISLLGAE